MKRILFTLILLIVGTSIVNAKEVENFYTEEELLNNEKIILISREEKIIFTTTKIDEKGNVLAIYHDEIPATDEENIEIAKQNIEKKYNMFATPYGWGPQISTKTEYKYLAMNYFRITDDPANVYTVQLMLSWYKMPLVKSYDVMAIRWEKAGTLRNAEGYQFTDVGTTHYSYKGKNMKIANNGVGISMNLYNDASRIDHSIEAKIYMANPGKIYGTYQHARNSNLSTLAQSQSYTFSANGLGQVLYFSNSTIRGYYDNMPGLVLNSSDIVN